MTRETREYIICTTISVVLVVIGIVVTIGGKQ